MLRRSLELSDPDGAAPRAPHIRLRDFIVRRMVVRDLIIREHIARGLSCAGRRFVPLRLGEHFEELGRKGAALRRQEHFIQLRRVIVQRGVALRNEGAVESRAGVEVSTAVNDTVRVGRSVPNGVSNGARAQSCAGDDEPGQTK